MITSSEDYLVTDGPYEGRDAADDDYSISRELDVGRALSSRSRWGILNSLSKGRKTISQIARETRLNSITIRYHLKTLMEAGLVKEGGSVRTGGAGRPSVTYELSKTHTSVAFPKRQYMLLSDRLIRGFAETLGETQAKQALTKMGVDAAEEVMAGLKAKHPVGRWTPELFSKYFVGELMSDMGLYAETIRREAKEVVYREYTCPFQEVALKYPTLVCDALDEGFHNGVYAALGPKVSGRKTKCMGRGDEWCEYSVAFGQ